MTCGRFGLRVGVPSRGFCFLGKTRPEKARVFGSRGFCFLGKPRPGKSRGVRVGVPSRDFCFLGKHDLKKAVVFGSALLAGAPAFWEKYDLKKLWCSGQRS